MAGTPIVLVIAAMYLFGAYAAAAGLPYPQRFTLLEAVRAAWATPTSSMLRSFPGRVPQILFVPGVLLGWTGYCLARRSRGLRRAVLVAAAVVPLACFGCAAAIAPLVALLCTPFMLFGTQEGEFYSEGFACMVAVGLWANFVLAVGGIEAARRRKIPGVCMKCGYSLSGLTTGICPECGSVSGGLGGGG